MKVQGGVGDQGVMSHTLSKGKVGKSRRGFPMATRGVPVIT
jgi:hypothetical protein